MPPQWNKYGPTAARSHGKPGREIRPSSTTIDIHSHVAVPEAAALVKPHLDPATTPLAHFADAPTKALSAKQEEDIRARITGYDARLAEMDAMGLDMQLIMPPPNMRRSGARRSSSALSSSSIPTGSPKASGSPASISATSSATRSKPRLRSIT